MLCPALRSGPLAVRTREPLAAPTAAPSHAHCRSPRAGVAAAAPAGGLCVLPVAVSLSRRLPCLLAGRARSALPSPSVQFLACSAVIGASGFGLSS